MKEGIIGWIQAEGKNEDAGKLVLRLTVGILMLFHGVSFIEGMFQNLGLPSFFAYGVFLGEILAPLMLILGFKVRLAALLIISTMVVAIGLTHAGDIFSLGKHGEWKIELPMFYIMASIALVLQGGGKYKIKNL